MTSFFGHHADLYDIFYKDKLYESEAAFIHQCLQDHSAGMPVRRLLELACGTGSHSFALEKYGYQIVATDYSEDMLSFAQRKAAAQASKVDFRLQDMRSLDLSDKPFDAAYCLFDSIGYVVTNEALRQVFQGVYDHLHLGSLFIVEFWHAAAMLRSYEPLRVGRWHTEEGEILRIASTNLELDSQIARVTYDIYELNENGTFSYLRETHVNRYFLVQEMAGWLTQCNFAPVKWFAGFSEDQKITQDTWHIVAIARRSK